MLPENLATVNINKHDSQAQGTLCNRTLLSDGVKYLQKFLLLLWYEIFTLIQMLRTH